MSLDDLLTSSFIIGLSSLVCEYSRRNGVPKNEEGFSYVGFSTQLFFELKRCNYQKQLDQLNFQKEGRGRGAIHVSEKLEKIFDAMEEWSIFQWNDSKYVILNVPTEVAGKKINCLKETLGENEYSKLKKIAKRIQKSFY